MQCVCVACVRVLICTHYVLGVVCYCCVALVVICYVLVLVY